MHIKVTLAVVLYTLGTCAAWALDDTPTLAPRYVARPDEGRVVSRPLAPLAPSQASSAGRSAAAPAASENDAVPATVRPAPLRSQPLTRVLPAEGQGGAAKLRAKPL